MLNANSLGEFIEHLRVCFVRLWHKAVIRRTTNVVEQQLSRLALRMNPMPMNNLVANAIRLLGVLGDLKRQGLVTAVREVAAHQGFKALDLCPRVHLTKHKTRFLRANLQDRLAAGLYRPLKARPLIQDAANSGQVRSRDLVGVKEFLHESLGSTEPIFPCRPWLRSGAVGAG